jgi:deoxycytidylate deaminase
MMSTLSYNRIEKIGIVPLTKRDLYYLELAMKIAANSQLKFKIGSIIVKKGNILSTGINVEKTHPLMRGYPKNVVSIHSEVKAIINARVDITGGTIYVARRRNDGTKGNSMPCDNCRALLLDSGIAHMVYCINGEVIKEKM